MDGGRGRAEVLARKGWEVSHRKDEFDFKIPPHDGKPCIFIFICMGPVGLLGLRAPHPVSVCVWLRMGKFPNRVT